MLVDRKGPLAGVRILDHFGMWAGPLATSMLAGMGAEVIKVESVQRYDGLRLLRVCLPGPQGHEWSAAFNGNNHAKLGVTLDLKDPRGRDLFLRLAAESDVVTESYRPDTAAKLRITYEDLREVNPDLIYLSLSGFGYRGPWAERPGYGATFSQAAGLAYVNGYEDGAPPLGDGAMWYSDVFNASMAAFAIVTALRHRDLTGEGQRIEQAQVEVTALLTSEYVLQAQAGEESPRATGNWRPGPEDVYPCLPGEEQDVIPAISISTEGQTFRRVRMDEWIAIAIDSDIEWDRLCAVAGDAGFAQDSAYRTAAGRLACRHELQSAIGAWTANHASYELAERLQAAGVRAAPVVNHSQALASSHFHERGDITVLERPVTGSHLYIGFPFHFEKDVSGWDTPSPTLGQHNREVLLGLLNLSAEEFDGLHAAGVIGAEPLWNPVT